jgi:hypothetical protein
MNVGLLRLQSAPIWKYLKGWWAEKPSFVWAPTGGGTGFVDLVSGIPLVPLNGAVVVPGGIVNTDYSSTSPILLQASTTIVDSVTYWGVMALVSGITGSQRGMILKVGNGSNGIGVAVGSTDESAAGTEALLLKEAIAWVATGPSNAWVDGVNSLWLQSDGFGGSTHVWPSDADVSSGFPVNAASGSIFINGRTLGGANNSTNFTVHCVFLYKNLWTSGAEEIAFRERLASEVKPLLGRPKEQIMRMFVPSQFYLPYASASSTYTMSAATYAPGSLTATGVTPRVTVTVA